VCAYNNKKIYRKDIDTQSGNLYLNLEIKNVERKKRNIIKYKTKFIKI
jgi:hypothetical protein